LLPDIPGGGIPAKLDRDEKTTLLLPFDSSLSGEDGENPENSPMVSYGEGIHGQAALVSEGVELIYGAPNNIDAQAGTVEFWIQPQWSGDDGGENDFLLFGEIPGAIFIHRVFGSVEIIANLAGEAPNFQVAANVGNTTWQAGEWYHVAFTWNSDKVQTYLDGTLQAETKINFDLPQLNASNFKIGSVAAPLNAYLDEFRISDTVRSAAEILHSYQSGGKVRVIPLPDSRPAFSDIRIHQESGDLLAYVSDMGYFHSIDKGSSWTQIDPNRDHLPFNGRTVLAIAPSNRDLAYVLNASQKDGVFQERFYRVDLSNETIVDRSANISSGEDKIYGNEYQLVVQVKPDNEDFVLVGGAQLFRSTNGFDRISDRQEYYIGGHEFVDPHVDNHIIIFDPNDPDVVWLGNDGGVWRTSDITRVASSLPSVIWQNKNNGYRVTQFYTVAIHPDAGAPQIMGGTQDRGTPTINQNSSEIAPFLSDAFGGDGSWCWYGRQYAYASAQGGEMYRVPYNNQGQPSIDETGGTLLAKYTEEDAAERFFIHPFVLDPNDENILYYPQANRIYRLLDNLDIIEGGLSVKDDWDHHPVMRAPDNSVISAIDISHAPPNILYYATSFDNGKIYRVAEAHSTNPIQDEYDIPGFTEGSFINNIAINPVDADEIVVVISSFNVPALFHSVDGGSTFSNVEGNLADDKNLPGPSFEWVDIHVYNGQKYYLLGSRLGLFLSEQLDGNQTIWNIQAEDLIGYQLVDMVVSRPSDGKVAIATHGRGIFTGFPVTDNTTTVNDQVTELTFNIYPNPAKANTVLFLEGITQVERIRMFDINGRMMPINAESSGKGFRVNLGYLQEGMYLIEIKNGNDFGRQRVMVF
ncbi:MAG: T9SS type A sorting domain-containing protein, partial [Saprospiraceae bacterium]|nr:T9SS type A sorting domain-containing protein [Saprospiraceae bacterium]